MSTDLASLVQTALSDELEGLNTQIRELVEPLTEQQFWARPLEPGNSAGHLILHLTGNLSHFIGGQLGKSGYVRDREREFSEGNPPSKAEALARLAETIAQSRRIIEGLSAEQLAAPHPETRFGSVLGALVHLMAHFALHRGQISYISRLVQNPGST
jgi:uncharacterized damage-inducible protein DinB